MQFLFSVIDDRTASGTPEEMAAISQLNERMRAAGQRVFAGGLAAPETATTVDNRDGRGLATPGATVTGPTVTGPTVTGPTVTGPTVTGPLGRGTAYLSGLWIIEVNDEGAAHELAREASQVCNRRVEVRAFLA